MESMEEILSQNDPQDPRRIGLRRGKAV